MKKYITLIFLFLLTVTSLSYGQRQKLAQTGLKFLGVTSDARIAAIGESGTSLEGASASMFFNPAGMARLDKFIDVSSGYTQWIADIKYIHGSVAFSPFNGDYGVFGFSFTTVDYGEFTKTIRSTNELGYVDIGTYKPTAFAFGIGYAKALSDKFSVGGNVKFVKQDLGTHATGISDDGTLTEKGFSVDALAFDFGVIYKTGFRSLNFGMNVRNFSEEVQYEEEGFQLPLIFKIGLSMNLFDIWEMNPEQHQFLLSIDASHPRDFEEQVHVGGEYTFAELVSLRAGYISGKDEGGFSAGFGVKTNFAGVDFAYSPFGVFDDVLRLTLNFSW